MKRSAPEYDLDSSSSLRNLVINQNRMLKRMENMDNKIESQIQQIKDKIKQL